MSEFEIDDKVRKKSGYKFPGVVVAKFETLSGKTRYVVECTAPLVQGCLHIYSARDLECSS